jgi:hypothetical protein
MGLIKIMRWSIYGLALSIVLDSTARADIVAVVSAKSQITAMDKSEVVAIFLSKARRFPNGVQAVPIDQAEGSAVRDEFYDKILGKTAAQMKAYWSKIIFTGRGQPPPSVSSDIEMKKRISENPVAIGYIDRSLVDNSVRVVL